MCLAIKCCKWIVTFQANIAGIAMENVHCGKHVYVKLKYINMRNISWNLCKIPPGIGLLAMRLDPSELRWWTLVDEGATWCRLKISWTPLFWWLISLDNVFNNCGLPIIDSAMDLAPWHVRQIFLTHSPKSRSKEEQESKNSKQVFLTVFKAIIYKCKYLVKQIASRLIHRQEFINGTEGQYPEAPTEELRLVNESNIINAWQGIWGN